MEFLNSTNLEILNQSNDPTFCNGLRLKVIDIALRSLGFWEESRAGRFHQNPPCWTTDILCLLYRAPYGYVKSGTPGAPNGPPFRRT